MKNKPLPTLQEAMRQARALRDAQDKRYNRVEVGAVLVLLGEVERLTEHSKTLNRLGWRMAAALGDVKDTDEEVFLDADALAVRFFKRFDDLEGEEAHAATRALETRR